MERPSLAWQVLLATLLGAVAIGKENRSEELTAAPRAGGIPYLIFSTRHELRSVSLANESEVKAVITSLKNAVGLDFYSSDDGYTLFWTDLTDRKVFRGSLSDGVLSNKEEMLNLTTVEGLAVDWIGENLYYVETHLRQIQVAKLNGAYRSTLISSDIGSPRAIALDARDGILFWSDWEDDKARIESASMSGEGRNVAVKIGDGWPNGMTLDLDLRRIYWIDAKTDSIHSAKYDGEEQREILRNHEWLSHPFGITLFENNVYWTDWRSMTITRANKFNGSDVNKMFDMRTQPFDVKALHPSRQPRDVENHPCKVDNGGCSHLCLLSFNGTRHCNCPHFMSLATDDNKTCVREYNWAHLPKMVLIVCSFVHNYDECVNRK